MGAGASTATGLSMDKRREMYEVRATHYSPGVYSRLYPRSHMLPNCSEMFAGHHLRAVRAYRRTTVDGQWALR